jgi:hypothetical protein
LGFFPDLCQMALSWASAPTPTIDPNPLKVPLQWFSPEKNVAATPSDAASTHLTRRFSLAHPPNLTSIAHPETRPDRLEQQLSHVRQLIATLPPDERLDLCAGSLLLRLSRLEEGEQSLRDCLSRPLCSELSRGVALYDLACVAARTDRPALCRELLEEAIRLLPQQRDQIAADPDFTSVSSTDWLKAMLPDKLSPNATSGVAQD